MTAGSGTSEYKIALITTLISLAFAGLSFASTTFGWGPGSWQVQIMGVAAAALTSMGYAIPRAFLKMTEVKAQAIKISTTQDP